MNPSRSFCAPAFAVLVGCAPPVSEPPDVVKGAGGQWEKRAAIAGGVRQEIGVVCTADEVFIVGGFSDAGITARVDAYAPQTDRWRSLPDLPEPLHHGNVAIVGDTIVVAGFLVGSGFDARADVYRLDLRAEADGWQSGTPMPGPQTRGAAAVTALGDSVYVFGGYRNGSVADASRYDAVTDTWHTLAPLPEALDHLGAATVDGALFVVGGRQGGLTNHTSALWLFEPDTETFAPRAPMPTSRAGFAAAALDGELLVVGGEGSTADDSGVFDEVEAWDPQTDTWRSLVAMRTPRHGMGACSVGGALYVPGGADVQGFAAVDVNERFVPRE